MTAQDAVERGFDALAPLLDRMLADSAISAEHAMHVVVMNPEADPRTPFDDAILAERSFGDSARWEADYAWYARAKTRLAWREQMSLRTLYAKHRERLRDDDIRVEGAVRQGRWIVGASGAQPWYDHATAAIAIALFEAAIEHAREGGNA
ncbi:MAG TPA: hypothetical protein VL654_09030 [Casimicrobiaceae bacterium]|nr:hypothetical protein [Casimicrobiaceae bacterium]